MKSEFGGRKKGYKTEDSLQFTPDRHNYGIQQEETQKTPPNMLISDVQELKTDRSHPSHGSGSKKEPNQREDKQKLKMDKLR